MGIDLTVVGSEVHLEKGIADIFHAHNLFLFGPTRQAARLETSKAYAKEFMAKFGIPTAKRLHSLQFPCVLKADGLAMGKGVIACKNEREADLALKELKRYSETIIIEEMLEGPEISLQIITDGEKAYPLLAAQDHKKLYDGDLGPNTGGMGAYAPIPFFTPELEKEIDEKIVQPTLNGLRKEKILYRGILYFGLMLTDEGPKVLEYNCRFGDPETQTILPLLESDLAELMLHMRAPPKWKQKASCCVVLASPGYPKFPITGIPIEKIKESEDLFVFHAGTTLDPTGHLITSGGRVFGITGLGRDLEEAIAKAYDAIDASWAYYRKDIGKAVSLSATK